MTCYRHPVGGAATPITGVKKQCQRWKKAAQSLDDSDAMSNGAEHPGGHNGTIDATRLNTTHSPTKGRNLSRTLKSIDLPYKFVPGARGSTMLYSISEKQLYRFKKGKHDGKMRRYECRVLNCKSAVYLIEGRLTKLESFSEHNHAEQEERVLKFEFREMVRRKCLASEIDPIDAFKEALNE